MSLTVTHQKYPAFYQERHKKANGSCVESKMPMTEAMMLPDVVLDALHEALLPIVPKVFGMHCELDQGGDSVPKLNKHRILIQSPVISWQQSCELVLAPLRRFSQNWAHK